MAEPAVASAQDVPEGFCLVRDHGDLHVKSVFMALVNCPLGVEALLLVLECDFETVSRREQEPSKDRRHAGRPAHDTQAQGGRPLQFVPCEGAHCRQCQSATRRSDGLAQGRLGRSARVKNTKKLFLCPDCFLLQIVCPTLSLVPHTIFFPKRTEKLNYPDVKILEIFAVASCRLKKKLIDANRGDMHWQ